MNEERKPYLFHEKWLEMTPVERRIQKSCCGFTLSWINQFVNESVRFGLYKLARRVLYLEKEVRRLKKFEPKKVKGKDLKVEHLVVSSEERSKHK